MLTIEKKTGRDAWLSGFAKNSVKVYKIGFDLFIEFMNETEEGEWNDQRLIKEREEDVRGRAYAFEQKLVEFYNWLKDYDNQNFSDNTRKSYLRAIRSFFAFHRLDVKFTRQQKAKVSKRPMPQRKYYDYTLEDLKRMASVSKPKERYVLLVGKELGLRASDFMNLKQGTFIAHLDEEPPISLGEVYTIKEGTSAKPFLGYDGKEAVKQWLTVLKSNSQYDPDKPMLEIGENELTEILKRLTKRASVNTGNEKIRFHQLRVFLITRLSKVMETNRWKQIVGKEVPESAYVKPFQLKEDYRKVIPMVTVNTTASMPQKAELETINQRIVDVQSENIMLRNTVNTLEKKLENQSKAFSDIKQILEVHQKTIEHLSEELGKAKRKA
jgi:hypothetical protein